MRSRGKLIYPWPHGQLQCVILYKKRVRQRGRGGQGEGKRLSNFILSGEKKKMNSRNEGRCTVHKQHSSCWYKHSVSGKDTKSLQSSLYQRHDNSAFDTLGYYHTVGSLFPLHKWFIQLHSIHFSWQLSLYSSYSHKLWLSRTRSPLNTHTHFPSHLTTTQWPCPVCFSLVSVWWKQGNQTIWLDYAGKSQGNPSHPLCSSKYPISTVLPACCIRQKHG